MGHSAMDHALMNDVVPWLFPVLWLLWGVYWSAQARGVKANVWAESASSRLLHLVPLVVAALLLLWDVPLLGLDERILPRSMATFWVGFSVAVAGLLFTVWARRHLAANWSGDVTIKAGHELITSGPYAWVRHPIYTGPFAWICRLGNGGGRMARRRGADRGWIGAVAKAALGRAGHA
jgi:protein-S-isoprenylcysteine O-methyltransferase Ste14